MRQRIDRTYGKLLAINELLICGMSLITLLFPVFSVKIFSFSEADFIWDYTFSSSSDRLLNCLKHSELWRTILRGNAFALAVLAILILFVRVRKLKNKDTENPQNYFNLGKGVFVFNAVYVGCIFFFTILLCIDQGRLVITYTWIPFLLNTILFVVYKRLGSHYQKAIRGEVEPLTIFGRKDIFSKQNNGELQKANLLLQYKEMLDMNIISQAEYDRKKKELLNEEHRDG